jgi:5-formyltetrahydrofolate cyclo-ligase
VTEAPDDAAAATRQAARLTLRRRLLGEREIFASSNAASMAEAALAKALCAVIADLEPGCLGLYHALRSEFNAAGALAADGRFNDLPLALPFARRAPRTMDFRRWDGGAPGLVDECGIAASAGALVAPDVVVVPCVGFTEGNHRLGYGGGYFDRWLAQHPEVTSVGVAWSFTEVAATAFAAQPHDIALSLIVTERGPR